MIKIKLKSTLKMYLSKQAKTIFYYILFDLINLKSNLLVKINNSKFLYN